MRYNGRFCILTIFIFFFGIKQKPIGIVLTDSSQTPIWHYFAHLRDALYSKKVENNWMAGIKLAKY